MGAGKRKPVISADSHITEPPDMYKGRVPQKYAQTAPHMVRQETGGDVFIIDQMPDPFPMTLASAAGLRGPALAKRANEPFDVCHRGGWDPKQRIKDQDVDGIAGEIIYPSLGMFLCNHPDLDYKRAMFDAYNEWLAEYCSYSPDRLFGLGQTTMTTPEDGIKDLERLKKMGMKGVMMPGFPMQEDYHHRMFDPFWEAAVALKMPLSWHILTYKDGLGKPRGPKLNAFMSIIRGNQDIIGTLIFGGVFERFPELKVVCAEADAGWAPHFKYRMDHALDRNPHWLGDVTLSKLPSQYFDDNVYVTFQDDLTAFQTKDLFNKERMMWASDFPHLDSTWPKSQALLDEHTPMLTPHETDLLVHDNVVNLYGLKAA